MDDCFRLGFFRRLRAQGVAARERRIVLLRGSETWSRQAAADLPGALEVVGACWLGEAVPGWQGFSGRVTGVLGQELDLVGIDLWGDPDPDAFGALAGALRAGGLLLLYDASARSDQASAPRLACRWARVLEDAPEVVVLEEGGEWPALAPPGPCAEAREPDADGCLTLDQRRAVQAVCRVATGHRRRPAVLTADRGRGKSSAFGLAAAALLRERGARVLVAGPSLAALAPVFDCAAARLPGAWGGRGVLHYRDGELRFMAPDALVRMPRPADLVLVDEAAALPLGLLCRLLERFSRIAFATTVHGYEGSGHAFAVRFSRVLDRRTPGWRAVGLEEPVRWAAGDPLESLTARLLLLDAEPAAVLPTQELRDCRVQRIDRDRLVENDAYLTALFGLLVLAHYRTRPRDLRYWLDGEDVFLWVLECDRLPVGVAIGVREGGLTEAEARAVGCGERRLRGHLIAQSLAAHLGFIEAAAMRGLRIVRIAVHPALQRRGLGARLLRGVVDSAQSDGLEWVGASFGAEPGLLGFWETIGFTPARIGFTREATSGAYAALVLRGLSAEGKRLQTKAVKRFAAGLPVWLGDPLRQLDADVALSLLAQARMPAAGEVALREARAFVRGCREVEDALPWVREVCLARLGPAWQADALDGSEATALMVKSVQALDWSEAAARLGVPGRTQVAALLREGVAAMLDSGK